LQRYLLATEAPEVWECWAVERFLVDY
jgi:hypothetical protein